MNKSFRPAILAALVAAAVASPALAEGDGGVNGMTPWYGDSWTNVQSQKALAPQATATPALQAQEEKAAASQAWAQTRENVRARTARARESTSNAVHRTTGTAPTTDRPTATGTPEPQAPAAYSDQGVAPGPAAAEPSAPTAVTPRGY